MQPITAKHDKHPLHHRAQSALAQNPHLSRARRVAVTAQEGRITLKGTVASFFQKQMAQESLIGLDGVQEIENQLEVL